MAATARLRVPPPSAHEGENIQSAHDAASDVVVRTRRPRLLSLDAMPEWFRRESNPWVLHGYRPISESAQASLSSLSYLHNESVNIYSHLIPAMVFLLGEWFLKQFFSSKYVVVMGPDFLAFSIFMVAAAACLSLSATYHLPMNHSAHIERLCLRLDMLGVVIFISGDLALGINLVFWCAPFTRTIYWSLIGLVGSCTIFTTLHPNFQGAQHRTFRAAMFVATGLCGVAPLTHGLTVFGVSGMTKKALPYTMAKAGCLLTGTLFYATRVPESHFPGKFDLWGSHAVFHVLVLCAAGVQLMGYLDAFNYAHGNPTC